MENKKIKELLEFFDQLTEKQITRFLYFYIFELPTREIATHRKCSHNAVCHSLNQVKNTFEKFDNHLEIVAALQEICTEGGIVVKFK